jgi:hypothetical protein
VVCTLLNEETSKTAHRLWFHLSTEDLFKCAADPNYLVQEIDVLLAEYAPDIWGMDTDRTRLLLPREYKQYQKQLVYEDDDDRQLLWLHFHRWIFAKAFVVLKDKVDSVEARFLILSRMRPINSLGSAFLVLGWVANSPLTPDQCFRITKPHGKGLVKRKKKSKAARV